MGRAAYLFRQGVKSCVPLLAKITDTQLLSKEETYQCLLGQQIFYQEASVVTLPPVKCWGGTAEDLQKPYALDVSSARVYCYEVSPSAGRPVILSYGGIKLNKSVLDLDFGNARYFNTLLQADKRKAIKVENCIPLWSHLWAGYYDFLLFVFAKLVRIKETIGEASFSNSFISYPLLGTSYEKELLALLGVREEQLIDTRNFRVQAQRYFMGNNESFFGPYTGDILALQKAGHGFIKAEKTGQRLIYIARAGRRKVVNEAGVRQLLQKMGFAIIEDIPRTVMEQMRIFRNARLIVGPHGAAFTNLLWCEAGTVLVELFAAHYYPPYFRFLAHVLKLSYYAVVEESGKSSSSHHSHLEEDIKVNLEELRQALHYILQKHNC